MRLGGGLVGAVGIEFPLLPCEGTPTVGQKPTRKGFGGRIIEQMIGQLNGEARFEWRTEGLVCEIDLRA